MDGAAFEEIFKFVVCMFLAIRSSLCSPGCGVLNWGSVRETCRNKEPERGMSRFLYAFFWVIPRRLDFIWRRFGTLSVPSSYLPAYEDGTVCSETSPYKIQTPENYPERAYSIQNRTEV
jgi:hypothetical protein